MSTYQKSQVNIEVYVLKSRIFFFLSEKNFHTVIYNVEKLC